MDPRDISLIYFWNPELNQYEVVPYRDRRRPPATLWELRAARERLRAKRELPDGKHTEAMIFEAIRRNRDLVEAAVEQKKKIKAAGKLRPGIHARRPKLKPMPAASAANGVQMDAASARLNVAAFDDLDFV